MRSGRNKNGDGGKNEGGGGVEGNVYKREGRKIRRGGELAEKMKLKKRHEERRRKGMREIEREEEK